MALAIQTEDHLAQRLPAETAQPDYVGREGQKPPR